MVALLMVAPGCGTGTSEDGQPPVTEWATVDPGSPPPPEPVVVVQAEPAQALPTTIAPAIAEALSTTALSTTRTAAPATTTAILPSPTTIPPVAAGPAREPQGGHPPHPEAGMIPRQHPYWDYPNCAPAPPWPADCYPPSEWEAPQDLSGCLSGAYPDLGVGGICAGGRADERPRWTTDVARWASWCFDQPRGNCTWLLHEMKWALDFLGAHPWCVLNEYQDRANAYSVGARGVGVADLHGWQYCATVVDPLVKATPSGRTNDAGLLLSGTVTLAEQCRTVLPADVQLETRVRRDSEAPERFGQDCDAWADWVETHPHGRDNRYCWRSARIAEEWMEHHHYTPERYFPVTC